MTYFPYYFVIDGTKGLLIWFASKDGDVFLKDENDDVLVFLDRDDFESRRGKDIVSVAWTEASCINIDELRRSIEKLIDHDSDKEALLSDILDDWNFFDDFIRTVGAEGEFLHLKETEVLNLYNKVFAHSHVGALTLGPGDVKSSWKESELKSLKTILNNFCDFFCDKISHRGD
ncbi:MAG: hypothetical protein KDJ39_13625 [Gammaproteobacteria bacterium]|nr:hypothetical protein [Gammaproteobacteria bacterium]MCP5299140.1 hypothetical protein [Chromatiaceae bacterium]